MKKTIILSLIILLMSFSFVFAEDCVWKKVTESSSAYNGIYEIGDTVYVPTEDMILYSNDNGRTFKTLAEKEGNNFMFVADEDGDFVVGSTKGLYILEEKKFIKILDTDPLGSFEAIVNDDSIFYGTKHTTKIIYKDGTGTESTVGTEVSQISANANIQEMKMIDSNIWTTVDSDSKLHYINGPSGEWSSTASIGSYNDIKNINVIDENIYATGKNKEGGYRIRYTLLDNPTWDDYPSQIEDIASFDSLTMYATANPLALITHTNGTVAVYKESGGDWKEYSGVFGNEVEQGKELVKLSNGELIVIANTTGKKNAVYKCIKNSAPIAYAGKDRQVFVGEVVKLDGSKSSDPDGDTIKYQWTQQGSDKVKLTGSTTKYPEFIVLKPGKYLFYLQVTDQYKKISTYDEVIVDAIAGQTYFIELKSTQSHFSWMEGNIYPTGSTFFNKNYNSDVSMAFKVSGKLGEIFNMPSGQNSRDIFVDNPVQSFSYYNNSVFTKASVYLKSTTNLNLKGDDITVRIRKGSIDGPVIAEATKSVEKMVYPGWADFTLEQKEISSTETSGQETVEETQETPPEETEKTQEADNEEETTSTPAKDENTEKAAQDDCLTEDCIDQQKDAFPLSFKIGIGATVAVLLLAIVAAIVLLIWRRHEPIV